MGGRNSGCSFPLEKWRDLGVAEWMFYSFKGKIGPRCPCLVLHPLWYMRHLPVKPSQGLEDPGPEHYFPSWTHMSGEEEVALHPEVEERDVGPPRREKTCNSS